MLSSTTTFDLARRVYCTWERRELLSNESLAFDSESELHGETRS